MIIIQLSLFNILLPFVIVAIAGGGIRAIKGVFFITLMCGISTLIPQYFVATYLGAELPAFAGSTGEPAGHDLMAKRHKTPAAEQSADAPAAVKYSGGELFRASAIYLLTFLFILLCSPLFPAIKNGVGQISSVIPYALSDTTVLKLKVEWLSTWGSDYHRHLYRRPDSGRGHRHYAVRSVVNRCSAKELDYRHYRHRCYGDRDGHQRHDWLYRQHAG